MTRILITGLKEPRGGVESAVLAYTRRFDPAVIQADLAVFGQDFAEGAPGCAVRRLPPRAGEPVAYRRAVNALFEQERYHAVWCNFSGLTNIDFLTAAAARSVPVRIAHAHTARLAWGGAGWFLPVALLHAQNRLRLPACATHYWACSRPAARFMFGGARRDVQILPNAVDTAVFRADPALRRSVRRALGVEHAPVVCHVGRMCRAKNQAFLLEIFKEMLALCPEARLLFAGDGELRARLMRRAAALGLADRVLFLGFRADVARLLQAADVFLLPSRTEGFPVVLTEAQAVGVPCVVSGEAVPRSADLTGRMRFVSLHASAAEWARAAAEALGTRDADGARRVTAAGYAIDHAAARLQRFFSEGVWI